MNIMGAVSALVYILTVHLLCKCMWHSMPCHHKKYVGVIHDGIQKFSCSICLPSSNKEVLCFCCVSLHTAAGVQTGRGEHQLLPSAHWKVLGPRGEEPVSPLPLYRGLGFVWIAALMHSLKNIYRQFQRYWHDICTLMDEQNATYF